MDIDTIVKITELTIEQVKKLQNGTGKIKQYYYLDHLK